MDRLGRPGVLALVGVCLLVGTLAVGALAAPTLGSTDPGDRQTLVGSQSTEGGWHEGGAVLLLDGQEEVWREDSAINYFDATMLDDGRVLAAFSHGGYEDDCAPYDPPCGKTGYRIIDPDGAGGADVIEEYAFPVRTQGNSEVHDAEALPNGDVLVADMEHERLFTVDDGEVTWQWNASSFYEAPDDPTTEDWLHLNDVDAINDTHYLASVRNANQLVVVEREAGVVEVINADRGGADEGCDPLVPGADGDVRCGDPAVLDRQHNPQWLGPGAVLVADSHNDRVVELHRDESTGRWEPVWSVDAAAGAHFDWPRDADRLANGNTLVTDTFNSRLVEVDRNGTAVWSAQLYNLPYEADRLPEGELAGAQRYAGEDEVDDPSRTVPLLTTAVGGLKGEYPIVPFWFAEVHLALSILGLLLVVVGAVDGLRVAVVGAGAADE